MGGPMGTLLNRAADIDLMLEHHIPIDVTAEEFQALKILWSERAKYELEESKRG